MRAMLKLIKAIRARYFLAVLAMALLVSMATGFMQYLLYDKQQDATVVNIAGMQRMLSQKVLLHAQRLTNLNNEPQAFQEVYSQLQSSIDRFAANHDFLISKSEQGNGFFSSELNQWYFSSPVQLDLRSRDFISRVRNLQLTDRIELDDLYQLSQSLLIDLDGAVQLFEAQANRGIIILRYVEGGIWLLAMVLLILEVKLIFRPMEIQVLTGIRELESQKKQTQQALNMKSRFLARASHELRTPLQSILGYLELFRKEHQAAHLEQAITSANQLNILINEMHDFSRWANDKVSIQISRADLPTMIETVVAPYRFAAQRKGLMLQVQMTENEHKSILCDHQHMAWVCSQLIDNAIKFSDSGTITLTTQLHTQDAQSSLTIQVSDQGQGLPTELIDSMSVHDDKNNHFQGMQLGLVRCQWLVNAMSGKLNFSNVPQGGACISFTIPVTVLDGKETVQTLDVSGKKALLVEDNVINAVVITKQLKTLGFDVAHVEHGKAALQVLETQAFDVIFMDLNMPHMDGYEAIEKIRNLLNLSTTVIVVTANDEQQDLSRAIALGGDACVIKPLQQAELITVLKELGVVTQ
ncbi:response regulator [Pseudoalteromonas sp. MMG022]|uniref:response regulator n=1 Tax=Pseudoalteromonas sp. MMG022 TaxID=2909978 RepID=UPI001F02D6A1|nr:response regulator [Pseudoalteromonas sp. MMG022]MCF6436600.1 response regulator [Pseudoalteromonas sp. MMG022]